MDSKEIGYKVKDSICPPTSVEPVAGSCNHDKALPGSLKVLSN